MGFLLGGVGLLPLNMRRGAPAPAPQISITIMSDQDSKAGEERDDNIGNVYALLRQDLFAIRQITAVEPGGAAASYADMMAAYEADRPQIIAKYPGKESRFKTGDELLALVQQASTNAAPSAGYDAGNASVPDTAAKRLMAAAVAHGDPDTDFRTDPYSKHWVLLLGGYRVLAQAIYEAVQLGAQPDFLKRIVVMGYVAYNAVQPNQNAWNYIVNGYANGTGPFADLTMINGMHNWYHFGDDNTATKAMWADIIRPASHVGAYLEKIRANSGYTARIPRAGDAGAFMWLADAHERGVFDPTATGNVAGQYQIDEGGAPTWGTSGNWPALRSWGPTIYNAISTPASEPARFGVMLADAFGGLAPPRPVLSFVSSSGNVSRAEGNSGANAYTFSVNRDIPPGFAAPAASVPITFNPGTTSPDDFVGGAYPSSLTAEFAAGATTATVTVNVQGDAAVEATETFTLTLTAPAGNTLGARVTATGTITNDDSA